jgi:hypothetical protein
MTRRLAAAFLVPLALLALGCAGEKKVYTREAFRKEFMGATQETVRSKLGRPDEVIEMPEFGRCWLYKNRTKDGDGAEVDDRVSLCFNKGRVYFISPVK